VRGGALNVGLVKTNQYERRYRTLCTTARCPYYMFNFDSNWNALQDFRVMCVA